MTSKPVAQHDTLTCADLLETVAVKLFAQHSQLSEGEAFDSVLEQSKEILPVLVDTLRLAVELGSVGRAEGDPEVSLLEEVIEPLLLGRLTRPHELAVVYARVAAAFRALSIPAPFNLV